MAGNNLWRLGMFGSRNADGSGEKFNYIPQTLNAIEASLSTVGFRPLNIEDGTANFDIAAVGCNDFSYVCMEFTKGPAPTPDFTISVVEDGISDNEVKVLCKRARCQASKYIFTFLVIRC